MRKAVHVFHNMHTRLHALPTLLRTKKGLLSKGHFKYQHVSDPVRIEDYVPFPTFLKEAHFDVEALDDGYSQYELEAIGVISL